MIGEFYFEEYKKQGRKGDTNMENKLKSCHAGISLMVHHTHEATKTRLFPPLDFWWRGIKIHDNRERCDETRKPENLVWNQNRIASGG